jgi:hypothetical protein
MDEVIPMKHRIPCVLAAAAMMAGLAFAGEDDPPKVRHDLAQVLQSEFKYDPAPTMHPEADTPKEVSTEGNVVAMPKLTVLSSRINMRDLEKDILKHQAQAAVQKPKWGCGPIYQKDFGKLRFGVISIFYVPVAIGFSW